MKYGVRMMGFLPDGMAYCESVSEVFDCREDAQKNLVRLENHPHPDHVVFTLVEGENLDYYSKQYMVYPLEA